MLFALIFLALCAQQIAAVELVVDLGYAKYRGADQGNGVLRWAGMRYARSVSRADGQRFAAPQDPLPEREGSVIDATDFGSICIGTQTTLQSETGDKQSEDCLFANVFAPANATAESKLPVYVFIQGGGFNANGNANYNGSDFIVASNHSMIIVHFNYRVGPYGFLASKEVVNEQLSVNNGLKDQRQLLKWVQTHISKFGGNPDHVTLGGASAGAGSVVLQLTAYGGRDDKLIHAAIAQSPAFPPLRNISNSQFMYDALLRQTGCANLDCMRIMPVVEFQNAVRAMKEPFPGAKAPPLYFWNPTIDDDFVKDYTYRELQAGHFIKVPTIFGDDQNDGKVFTPKTVTSLESAQQFVANQFPNINGGDQKRIIEAWKLEGPAGALQDAGWQNIAADIYAHIRYTCPALNASASLTKHSNLSSWQYRWNFGTALHVSELGPLWSDPSNPAGHFLQQYWISFIKHFDPNKDKVIFYGPAGTQESPTWEAYGTGGGRRMEFGNGSDVAMEGVGQDQQEKCRVITSIGTQLEQPPASAAKSPGSANSPGSARLSSAPFLSAGAAWIVAVALLIQVFIA